jgi:hypothetical protein
MPGDVVRVSDDDYRALVNARANGKIIELDENSYPIAVDPPPTPTPSPDQLQEQLVAAVQQSGYVERPTPGASSSWRFRPAPTR